jgi:hypothetical protein
VNDWEVPELDLDLCADRLVAPVTKWGTRRRSDPMPGTWHFYCNDYVFTHLLRIPGLPWATRCTACVEANFSTCEETPLAEILWWTFQKRRIAREWQSLGIRVLVDLNVALKAREINLLGVPKGWTAYATRAHRGAPFEAIHDEFLLACEHAGTEDILFVVFGGGRKRIGQYCRHNGWPWVPEHRQVVQGLERPYAQDR